MARIELAEIGDQVEYVTKIKTTGRVTAADSYAVCVDGNYLNQSEVRIITKRAVKVGDILDTIAKADAAPVKTVATYKNSAYAKHQDGYWYRTGSSLPVNGYGMYTPQTKVVHVP